MDKRYPFKLITATRGNRMKILAVAHHGQAPGYWEDRLEDMDEDDEDEKKTKTKKRPKKSKKSRTVQRKRKTPKTKRKKK